jgi:hypothetical protein
MTDSETRAALYDLERQSSEARERGTSLLHAYYARMGELKTRIALSEREAARKREGK